MQKNKNKNNNNFLLIISNKLNIFSIDHFKEIKSRISILLNKFLF